MPGEISLPSISHFAEECRTVLIVRQAAMSKSLGIPVKLLHEAEGHTVTVELKSGELYRGQLLESEDNWNCQLESITCTAKVLTPFAVK